MSALRQTRGALGRFAALGAVATFSAGLAGGCAAIAGLGDEARLREAQVDAGPQADTGPEADTGPLADAKADARPVGRCGLVEHPRSDCADYVATNCCDEARRCAAFPSCVAAVDCIFGCGGDQQCLLACIAGDTEDEVGKLSGCSASAPRCYPTATACLDLGKCCRGVPASLAVQKEGCQVAVLRDDPEACTTVRGTLLQYCPSPDGGTPVDAASDAPKDVAAQ